MKKWEYRIIETSAGLPESGFEALSKAGKEGWELVAAVPKIELGITNTICFIFKREVHHQRSENPDSLVREAWKEFLRQYKSGKIILRNERDLENSLVGVCKKLAEQKGTRCEVASQETHMGKRVDLRLGPSSMPVLVQLKLYHDPVDWKETPSMRNTVESDLKFAKGHGNVYVGIIDVVPSSSRPKIPFKLEWETIELDEKVFQQFYVAIHPKSSPQRERIQKAVLVNGAEI